MLKTDLGKLVVLDYTVAAKKMRKDPELEYAVISGLKSIAVLFKGTIAGYIASRKLIKTLNLNPQTLPYGHLFLSHYGDLWEDIEGQVFEFGENYPIAIAADLFRKKDDGKF